VKLKVTGLFLSAGLLGLGGCGENRGISGKVPPLTLQTYAGESYTLDEEGKDVTLLVFWATWCQPCLMEIPSLNKLHEKYRDRRFRVLAINVDDPDGGKVKAISGNYGIKYPVLVGSEDTMRQFGGVTALPTSFLIGRDGKIKDKMQGLVPEDDLERRVLEALGPTG
jgi:thiol-disulfide isomerase/thioredoxin